MGTKGRKNVKNQEASTRKEDRERRTEEKEVSVLYMIQDVIHLL